MSNENTPMNVGVIGLGWMGKLHLRVYSELPGVNVVGVMDTEQAALDEVHERFGVPTFDNLDDLLSQPLDAVSVCVPTVYHLPVGLKVMDAGVPLLIEKPLAASADEGRQLLDKANEKGLPLMVGHIERFNPAVRRVKELVEDNGVISIQIERVGPYPPRIQDVGVMRDLGSHDIDLIRFITGSEYKSAYAVTSTTIGKHEDTALITAEMENGVLAHVNTNWVTPYKSRFIHIATKDRYIAADLITQQVKAYSKFEGYDAHYSIKEWPVMYREPVVEELKAFLAAVKDGTPLPITGEDGLKVLEIIERLEQCAC
ncbi:Gfo/Idh/MocA family protein [Desulfovibrio ferrophilus]|uniref:Oxidoreductase domain-containing protein n=1 Tax=Desulfovibrio ferrophilus TaxID=241368 RepID=A0A2Z6AYR6_9BACT|nr:Gfo/Idh/MocA family oxidoreductase [Desulfovibrio ferrophilus]BBD08407.1 oxidoreductase domain-containing protein [Desulfovibrio ferrophilus]